MNRKIIIVFIIIVGFIIGVWSGIIPLSVTSQVLINQNEYASKSMTIGSGSSEAMAQGFEIPSSLGTVKITDISIYFKEKTGTSIALSYCGIVKTLNDDTFNDVNKWNTRGLKVMGSCNAWTKYDLSTDFEINPGVRYHIIYKNPSLSTSSAVFGAGSDPYGSVNLRAYRYKDGKWSDFTKLDVAFQLHGYQTGDGQDTPGSDEKFNIVVYTTPNNCNVIMDGVEHKASDSSGTAHFTNRGVGAHYVDVNKDGYYDKTAYFDVPDTLEVYVTLTPLDSGGEPSVPDPPTDSTPDVHITVVDDSDSKKLGGVKVTIGGTVKYTDSDGLAVFNDMSQGDKVIALEKDGYKKIFYQGTIENQNPTELEFRIKKAGIPGFELIAFLVFFAVVLLLLKRRKKI